MAGMVSPLNVESTLRRCCEEFQKDAFYSDLAKPILRALVLLAELKKEEDPTCKVAKWDQIIGILETQMQQLDKFQAHKVFVREADAVRAALAALSHGGMEAAVNAPSEPASEKFEGKFPGAESENEEHAAPPHLSTSTAATKFQAIANPYVFEQTENKTGDVNVVIDVPVGTKVYGAHGSLLLAEEQKNDIPEAKSSSEDDDDDESSEDEGESKCSDDGNMTIDHAGQAPIRLLMKFIEEVNDSNTDAALQLADEILSYEPENAMVVESRANLLKLKSEEQQQQAVREQRGDEDDVSDGSSDTSSSSESGVSSCEEGNNNTESQNGHERKDDGEVDPKLHNFLTAKRRSDLLT